MPPRRSTKPSRRSSASRRKPDADRVKLPRPLRAGRGHLSIETFRKEASLVIAASLESGAGDVVHFDGCGLGRRRDISRALLLHHHRCAGTALWRSIQRRDRRDFGLCAGDRRHARARARDADRRACAHRSAAATPFTGRPLLSQSDECRDDCVLCDPAGLVRLGFDPSIRSRSTRAPSPCCERR